MTLLITSPVDRKDHAECASQLMRYESVHAEQTGFVEKPRNEKAAARLQMAGGEFCGNAAMALAALIARDKKLMHNGTHPLLLEVSGHSALVECLITPKDGYFIGKVRIPSPQFAESKEITVGDGVRKRADGPFFGHNAYDHHRIVAGGKEKSAHQRCHAAV
jgi:Diaminopimelate epimerase